MAINLQLGLMEDQHAAAAALYWQAFGGKLGPVMGPEARALTYLLRVIRPDHVIAALSADGEVVGIAGFKTTKGSFASGSPADLNAVYGRIGGLWRGTLLRWIGDDVDNERFLVDGICVKDTARGQGIGTALLAALAAEARLRGYGAVRLDVIDSNHRAIALYERQGYGVVKRQPIGLLRHVFGFAAALTMVRTLT